MPTLQEALQEAFDDRARRITEETAQTRQALEADRCGDSSQAAAEQPEVTPDE